MNRSVLENSIQTLKIMYMVVAGLALASGLEKLVFDDKEDLKFFQDQGFQFKTVIQSFSSKLPDLTDPL